MIDYLSQNIWLIWVLVSLLCLILELGSGDLFILSFSVGAAGMETISGSREMITPHACTPDAWPWTVTTGRH